MKYCKFFWKPTLPVVVLSVALHPEKQILATASDDRTWKLWSLPNGELILTGHGHSDWVAGCDFHPSYVVFSASQVLLHFQLFFLVNKILTKVIL